MEIWKDVADFEGYYEVSNTGRVRNKVTGCFIKPNYSRGIDMPVVTLYADGKKTSRTLAKTVAQAFVPNPEGLSSVTRIHKNFPFVASNLRWWKNKKLLNQKPRSKAEDSICWNCQNGMCDWVFSSKPIQGWEVVKTHSEAENGDLIRVIKCPEFIKEWRG